MLVANSSTLQPTATPFSTRVCSECSMGSHSLDTKTTLSVSDITAVSPAALCAVAQSVCQNIQRAWSIYYMMFWVFFDRLPGTREEEEEFLCAREKRHSLWTHRPPQLSLHQLWWTQKSSLLTTRERPRRIRSRALSRMIARCTCRALRPHGSRHTWSLWWSKLSPGNFLI